MKMKNKKHKGNIIFLERFSNIDYKRVRSSWITIIS